LNESRRTRSKEKRDLYARILRERSSTSSKEGTLRKSTFTYISDLTLKELRVARLLYETRPGPEKGYWEQWKNEVCGDLNIDRDDLSRF
jgi:hypothetical protein